VDVVVLELVVVEVETELVETLDVVDVGETEEVVEVVEEVVVVEVELAGFAVAKYTPTAATTIMITTITAITTVEIATLLFTIGFKRKQEAGQVSGILIERQSHSRGYSFPAGIPWN
jgi:hypothetical protein